MEDGEMILMDCGAEYGYYSADITRSVPVNGKFSEAQKDIYKIVLAAQKVAIQMVKPGIKKSALDEKIDDILGTGLVNLGLLKDKKDYRIYSLHGYAHWIGLEVHDVGAYTKRGESIILKPGMTFTVEPGLYVRPDVFEKMAERGYSKEEIDTIRPVAEKYMYIGVRIEDDIVVTENGFENLTKSVPREIDEIEKLMSSDPVNIPVTESTND
jgi:Xaa-Pro aminopeptidase